MKRACYIAVAVLALLLVPVFTTLIGLLAGLGIQYYVAQLVYYTLKAKYENYQLRKKCGI